MNEHLAKACATAVAQAQEAFDVTTDKAAIKASTTALRDQLKEWMAKTKTTENAIRGLLKLVQDNCNHQGAERGCNERDGSWMNACPHCGKTE